MQQTTFAKLPSSCEWFSQTAVLAQTFISLVEGNYSRSVLTIKESEASKITLSDDRIHTTPHHIRRNDDDNNNNNNNRDDKN